MDHRAKLDAALRTLPPPRAAYLARVVYELDRRPEVEERAHLLYPVLAAAAPGIEPMLEPGESAAAITLFLLRDAEGIAATLYSPAFITAPATALAPWAERLKAELAILVLDRLATGRLQPPDRRLWRFRPDQDSPAFPYGDGDGEGEEEADG